MKMHASPMSPKNVMRCPPALLLCGACLLSGLTGSTASAAPAEAAGKAPEVTSIKGTCTFRGKENNWSAKLTPKGEGVYDAVYVSSWSGKSLDYVGTIKTDLKTTISGDGKASGGNANGTFEFSGTYGTNGLAQCSYKETNGRRRGTMTAGTPK